VKERQIASRKKITHTKITAVSDFHSSFSLLAFSFPLPLVGYFFHTLTKVILLKSFVLNVLLKLTVFRMKTNSMKLTFDAILKLSTVVFYKNLFYNCDVSYIRGDNFIHNKKKTFFIYSKEANNSECSCALEKV
jgi:hypothetical protein